MTPPDRLALFHRVLKIGHGGRFAGAITAILWGCELTAEGKTACRDSSDCLTPRVCVANVCQDDACEALCGVICQAKQNCEQDPGDDCPTRCLQGDSATPWVAPTLAPKQCGELWDAWSQGDECEQLDCALACAPLCRLAHSCALVVDEGACFAGCLSRAQHCQGPVPADCVSVPQEVACYENPDACAN